MRLSLFSIGTVMTMMLTAVSIRADVEPTVNIVEHITANGDNIIIQPAALGARLEPVETPVTTEQPVDNRPTHGRMAGYRIQVFSDNNVRTAKNEARTKSRNISARFPQYKTYVMYTSPYWRLKVGDFRNRQDAEDAAEELRRAFPTYAKEIRVVRDRVNITE